LFVAQGEDITFDDEGNRVIQRGWRLMRGIDFENRSDALAVFDALNELWIGALAAYDRFLRLDIHCEFDKDWEITWQVHRRQA
jgi:hypothetical protein